MAQHSYQVGKKLVTYRGNRRHITADLEGERTITNTPTHYYSTPKIFDAIAEQKLPGDEGWHVNYQNDIFVVPSAVDTL